MNLSKIPGSQNNSIFMLISVAIFENTITIQGTRQIHCTNIEQCCLHCSQAASEDETQNISRCAKHRFLEQLRNNIRASLS